MKLSEALQIIEQHEKHGPRYRINFERREGGVIASDFFPGRDELGIDSEEYAWGLAEAFARATNPSEIANIYVIRADNFVPVPGWEVRRFRPYISG